MTVSAHLEGKQPLVTGSVARAYVDHLAGMGLLEQVKPRLSPAALKMVEKPPLAVSWIESKLTDELAIALYELRSREAVRELGLSLVRGSVGKVLKPLLGTSLQLFGATPSTLFGRIETYSSLLVRNAEITWRDGGPNAGTLVLQHGVPLHDAAYANWEGVFLYGFELLKMKGEVGKTRVLDGGRQGEIPLRW